MQLHVRSWNTDVVFGWKKKGHVSRKNINLAQARASENASLSNKIEIMFIIDLNVEGKIIPNLFSATFEDMVQKFHNTLASSEENVVREKMQ